MDGLAVALLFGHINSTFLGTYDLSRDVFGAFISGKCTCKLLVRSRAKAKHLPVKWLDINPGSREAVEINTRLAVLSYGDAASAGRGLLG